MTTIFHCFPAMRNYCPLPAGHSQPVVHRSLCKATTTRFFLCPAGLIHCPAATSHSDHPSKFVPNPNNSIYFSIALESQRMYHSPFIYLDPYLDWRWGRERERESESAALTGGLVNLAEMGGFHRSCSVGAIQRATEREREEAVDRMQVEAPKREGVEAAKRERMEAAERERVEAFERERMEVDEWE
ncbi:hypothetical protein ACFE04_021303 [Oxalis oulophora]